MHQSSTQDLNDSKGTQHSNSMERYLQLDTNKQSMSPLERITVITNTPNATSSILKLQNGKFNSQSAIFKAALIKKKQDACSKKSSIPVTKVECTQKMKKPVKNLDKIRNNIAHAKDFKHKEPKAQEPLYKQIKEVPQPVEQNDQAFLETVERLYTYEKRRKTQLEKTIVEAKEREMIHQQSRPQINERSCKILEKKLKEVAEHEEEYNKLYMFREKSIQADLLPNLPKLRDAIITNCYSIKKKTGEEQSIQIVKQLENEEQDNPLDKCIQTDEIKFKISDLTDKKNVEQQAQTQISQFQTQETPKKKNGKVTNQRDKRIEIMENKQQLRVRTECEYYVPIQERYKNVIQHKEKWVKEQQELKKQKEEEEGEQQQQMSKSMVVFGDEQIEEFNKQQMGWLERRNDHIVGERMKKDKEFLEGLTFKPQISKRSQHQMTKGKVEDRLLGYQSRRQDNIIKLEEKYLPTFTPNLHTKSFILSQHLSQNLSQKSLLNASFNNNNLWQ